MDKQQIRLEIVKLTYRHDKTPKDIVDNAQSLFDFVYGDEQDNASVKSRAQKPAIKLNNNKE